MLVQGLLDMGELIQYFPLGGIGKEAIAEARRRGGQGVAGIRAFW